MTHNERLDVLSKTLKSEEKLSSLDPKKIIVEIIGIIKFLKCKNSVQIDDLFIAVIYKIIRKKKYSKTLVKNAVIDELRLYLHTHYDKINGKYRRFFNESPEALYD